jgi:hypothetical protein
VARSVERNVVVALGRLVEFREPIVFRLDPADLFEQGRAIGVAGGSHHLDHRMAEPEGVLPPIATGLQTEDFLEDLQVMRDRKGVAAVFVAEEIVEIVEARPGDRRHAHGAGFVRREENQILGIWPLALFVEALQRMHLAMPERIFEFVVGLGQHQRKIRLAQDSSAKHLVAGGHATGGQGQDVVFDHVEKSTGKFRCGQGGALRSLVQCDPSACRAAAEREMMLCLQLFGARDSSSLGERSVWAKLGAFCSQRRRH